MTRRGDPNHIFLSGIAGRRIAPILVLLMLCTAGHAADIESAGKGAPITVTSDRLETLEHGGVIVFSGQVAAEQERYTIHCDELRIYYRQSQAPGKGAGAVEKGEVEKIEARRNVSIEGEHGIISGDHAVLYHSAQKVVVTGNVVMKEGENTVKGDSITFFLKDGKGIVESLKEGRVKATIYPKKGP